MKAPANLGGCGRVENLYKPLPLSAVVESSSLKNKQFRFGHALCVGVVVCNHGEFMRGEHLNCLDGWRGLAITFLLIGHFFDSSFFGIAGVNLFFVLSGLLMARILFVQETSISVFYKRRASRIFPAVFAFLGAVTLLFFASGKPIAWLELATSVLFVTNYFFIGSEHALLPFGHIWSLSVEEHSYILLSLIAIASRKKWVRPIFAIAAVACLAAAIGLSYAIQFSGGRHLQWVDLIRTEVSSFGILTSSALMLYFNKRTIPILPWLTCPSLLAFGLAIQWWWATPDMIRLVVGVGSFALALNLLPKAPLFIQSALSFKPLRQLGIWSFSIYLWQQPFYVLVRHAGMSPWLGLAFGFISGLASFYLIENPARRALNKRWGGAKPTPLNTSAPRAN